MPRSNTEEKKRTNNHYQNAESSLERYFHFPYQYVKKIIFSNFFSLENAILFFHTFKTSVGTLIIGIAQRFFDLSIIVIALVQKGLSCPSLTAASNEHLKLIKLLLEFNQSARLQREKL